jgi:hypothetical protein
LQRIVSPFRTRTEGAWLDLELGLWTELAEKVKSWGRKDGTLTQVPSSGDRTLSEFDRANEPA